MTPPPSPTTIARASTPVTARRSRTPRSEPATAPATMATDSSQKGSSTDGAVGRATDGTIVASVPVASVPVTCRRSP